MLWKLDKTLGYMYGLDKENPYSDVCGKVYQHHHVMCSHIGRRLLPDECVHHIDRNKTNNDLSNLMLLTISEHAKLHAIEDRGYVSEQRICGNSNCNAQFITSAKSLQKYCKAECAVLDSRVFEINAQDLDALVWSMPTTKVAKILGVSDVAVGKRCKKLGVSKPPRGYWAKLAHA